MNFTFEHTPASPAYAVDWPAIRRRFRWIKAMRGVEQEPEWHAEGDVEIHTRMVAEAMAADADWRALPAPSAHALFLSALLHDVAKPQCTRFEEGRWTSPKHAKVGERVARNLLWKGEVGDIPEFAAREFIAKLVRYHGAPLRFLDREEPERFLTEMSQEVNLDSMAMLALADVIGRECADKPKLLESVQMFCDFAEELGCLRGRRAFESDHHRFMYCVGRKPFSYVPYDDTWGEVVMMSGIPGSGKTTIVKERFNDLPQVRMDDLRAKLGIDPSKSADQASIVSAAQDLARDFLRAKKPFVWDATMLTKDWRSAILALCAKYGARLRIVYCEAPTYAESLRRNRERDRQVPESKIAEMAAKLEIPSLVEAHTVEYIVTQ